MYIIYKYIYYIYIYIYVYIYVYICKKHDEFGVTRVTRCNSRLKFKIKIAHKNCDTNPLSLVSMLTF